MEFTSVKDAKDLELFKITNNKVRASNNTDWSVILDAAWYVKLDFLQQIKKGSPVIKQTITLLICTLSWE